MNFTKRLIDETRHAIEMGLTFEDLIDAFAGATVPLLMGTASFTKEAPGRILDRFQHIQDTKMADFLEAQRRDHQQTN